MGLIVFISIVAAIAIIGYLVASASSAAPPPYQPPVVEQPKEDISASWPFPTTKP